MALALGPRGGEDEDAPMASINTTPLVDVMLVLLIIFLITIPVVTHSVPVALPQERDRPTQTSPRTITLSIDKTGGVFWNDTKLADLAALAAKLEERAAVRPPPEVQIRADRDVRYETVGRVVGVCHHAGIGKIAFILRPDRAATETP